MSDLIKTGKVRFAYLHVFTPKVAKDAEADAKAKYSVCLIIPKSDKVSIKRLQAAIEETGKAKFGEKLPKNFKSPLRDGDLEREDSEVFEGCFFMNASTTQKPGLVDADLEEIASRDEIYSGCFGRAVVNFFGYDTKGNKGVGCGLRHLQKLEDGDVLSDGGVSAAEAFGKDDDDDLL
jgi:hypothetical protein